MKWLALALAIAVSVVVIASAAFVLASHIDSGCDTRTDERLFDPSRHDIWATTSSGVCTGFGGSWASVDVGEDNKSAGKVVFTQSDADATPRVSWTTSGVLEIHVATTLRIGTSEISVDGVPIRYVIPKSSSKESLERELSNWKIRSRADILAGKADFSGGDVQGNLRNLDKYARDAHADIDRFVQWTERVKARVE